MAQQRQLNRSHMERALVSMMVALLCLLALLPHQSAVGQSEIQPSYRGIDVVVLVDQSGSMGGLAYGSSDHPTANDPNDLRFDGTRLILEILGESRVNAVSSGRDIDFRVAVVDFGDFTETRLEPETIVPDSEEQWTPQLRELQDRVSAASFGQRNFGNTNHLLAFQRARELFDVMEAQNAPGPRLKAIVLLTDGIPYVLVRPASDQATPTPSLDGQPAPTPTPAQPIPVDRYMRDLFTYVNTAFPPSEFEIFVVGMNDSDRDQWRQIERYWQQITGGQAKLTENNEQVGATLQEFLFKLLGDPGIFIPCGSHPVNPYLRMARFTVHKAKPQDRISIRVNGVDLNLEDPAKARVTGAERVIERIVVFNPEPGFWDIICPPTARLDPKIFFEPVPLGVDLFGLSNQQLQYVPVPIRLKLSGYGGSPLPQYTDPQYKLQVNAEIVQPSGSVSLPLALDAQGFYSTSFVPTEVGEHMVRITARTQSPTGEPLELLDGQENAYQKRFVVSSTRPRLLSAAETTVLVPTTIEVEIQDDTGQRVSPDVFTSLGSQLAVALDEPAGTQTFPIQPQADGTLVASVTPLQAGSHPIRLAASTTASGQSLDEQLGTLYVQPMRVELVGLADAQAQYKTMPLTVRLIDRQGKPIEAPREGPYSLSGKAILTGAENLTSVLQPMGNGLWSTEVRPQNAGAVGVHVNFGTISDPQRTVLDADAGQFHVAPTTLVSLAILRPANGAEVEYNKPLPFLYNPFDVEIELRGDGKLLDPAKALVNAGQVPFELSLTDGEAQNRSSDVKVEPAGEPGRWRIRSDILRGRDTYQVSVMGNATLKPAFVWDEQPASVAFTQVPNRFLPVTYAASALLLAVVLVLLGKWANNRFIQPKARGELKIEDSNQQSVVGGSLNLDARNTHSVTWKPSGTHGVKSVKVSGQKNGGVKARVSYLKGGSISLTLTRGNPRKVLKDGFWLVHRDTKAVIDSSEDVTW